MALPPNSAVDHEGNRDASDVKERPSEASSRQSPTGPAAPQAPQRKVTNWPDLTPDRESRKPEDRAALYAHKFPSGKHFLLLVAGSNFKKAAREMGYRSDPSGAFYWKPYAKLDQAELRKYFPDLVVRPMPHYYDPAHPDEMYIYKAPNQINKVSIQSLIAKAKPLGKNRAGMDVFEGIDGRFYRDHSNRPLREADLDPPKPFLFLRATTDADLALCADGLVLEAAEGRKLYAQDVVRFAKTVYADDTIEDDAAHELVLGKVRQSIEDAFNRRLSRLKAPGMAEVFTAAVQMEERAPEGILSVPLPVGIVAQRLLGNDVELEGRRIAMTLPEADAQMMNRLPRGAMVSLRTAEEPDEADRRLRGALRGNMPVHDVAAIGTPHETAMFSMGVFRAETIDPVMVDAEEITRADYVALLEDLDRRDPEGRSVFVVPAPRTALEADQYDFILSKINSLYHYEGGARIESSLYGTSVTGHEHHILAVGPRRVSAEPMTVGMIDDFKTIDDFRSLWTWSSRTLADRLQIEAAHRVEAGNKGKDEEIKVAQQVSYRPASRPGESRMMIPRYLEAPVRRAMAAIARRHGEIAPWVAGSLQWTVEEMFEVLSPEQVDAVAMIMDARERDLGFLLADEGGAGKGRVFATIARWNALNGKLTTFLTERANLLSDFVRDLRDIRSLDLFMPFIVNNGVEIRNTDTNEVLFRGPSRALTKSIMADPDPLLICRSRAEANEILDAREAAGEDVMIDEDVEGEIDEDVYIPTRLPREMPDIDEVMEAAALAGLNLDADPEILWQQLVEIDREAGEEEARARAGEEEAIAEDATETRVDPRDFPCGVNLILGTYSQINKRRKIKDRDGAVVEELPAEKAEFLINLVRQASLEGMRPALLSDECHNIVGDTSNSGKNWSDLSVASDEHMLGSATFAEKIQQILVFKPLFPRGTNLDEFADAVRRGGKVVAEAFTETMAKNGTVRRVEKDFSALTVEYVPPKDYEARNVAFVDALAPVINAMAVLSGEAERIVSTENAMRAQNIRHLELAGRRVPGHARMQVSRLNFGSPLYRLGKYYLTALKLDQIADAAILDLQEGRKPFIVLDNTNDSILKDLQADLGDGVLDRAPDFKDALRRVLKQMVTVKRPQPDGSKREVNILEEEDNPAMRAAYEDVVRLIEDVPDLPVSPFDYLRQRIEATGATFGEVSGRTREYRDGRIQARTRPDTAVQFWKYNNDEIDVLAINAAGATGASAQASPRFRNQNQRVLYMGDPPPDIRKFMQALWRVDRLDQLTSPILRFPATGLPAEVKYEMIMRNHLRSLSAHTQANQENPLLREGALELFDGLGNEICRRFIMELRPDLKDRFGLSDLTEEDIEDKDQIQLYYANRLLSYIGMLSNEEGREVIDEIVVEQKTVLDELDARGMNPRRAKVIEGNWTILSKRIFQGADLEEYGPAYSAYDEPVYLVEAEGERFAKPLRGDDIIDLIDAAEMDFNSKRARQKESEENEDRKRIMKWLTMRECSQALEQRIPRVLDDLLPGSGYVSVEQAIDEAAPDNKLKSTYQALTKLHSAVRRLEAGSEIRFETVTGEIERAVVTRIETPMEGHEDKATQYHVCYVRPGDEGECRTTLHALLRDESFQISKGINGDTGEQILRRFDQAPRGAVRERRRFLTGNLLEAMRIVQVDRPKGEGKGPAMMGQAVLWRDQDNVMHRSVLLNRAFDRLIEFDSPRLNHVDQAFDYLMEGVGTKLCSARNLSTAKGVVITVNKKRQCTVRLPNQGGFGGDIWNDPRVMALIAEVDDVKGGKPILRCTVEELRPILASLYGAGVRFYIPSEHREWFNAWAGQHLGEVPAPAADDAVANARIDGIEPVEQADHDAVRPDAA